jgi:DNA modification methylase
MNDEPNILYYGDNLDVLRRHIRDESVDLVYLDPPFNSKAEYNVIYAEHGGTRATAQVRAFEDTWHWDAAAADSFYQVVEAGGRVADALVGFQKLFPASDLLAYLSMMAPRLVELHRVLKPTGLLYLHCDPTASHSLKLLLDAIFGPSGLRNEIVWAYSGGGIPQRDFPRKHHTIFRYAKGATWFYQPEFKPYKENTRQVGKHSTYVDVSKRDIDLERGTPVTDWWTDIKTVTGWSPERLGYQTQKPQALLARIIETSCPPDGLVLDPFCGCGTAIDAAQALGRQWVGIDITHLAIGLIKYRLIDRYGPGIANTYRVVGEPTTVEDAAVLAEEDPFQFQAWALGLVGARPVGEMKKGGDKGIDGRLYFHDSHDGQTRQIVFSVKSGGLVPSYLRDLRGVLDREEADIGVLISFEEPSAGIRAEAASAGFYVSPWGTSHRRPAPRWPGHRLPTRDRLQRHAPPGCSRSSGCPGGIGALRACC